MRASTAIAALCVFLAAASATAQVAVLGKATFDTEVFNSGKNVLVKFYAPW